MAKKLVVAMVAVGAELLAMALLAPLFIGSLRRIDSSSSRSNSSNSCCSGRVFVYDLPPKFNAELVARCSSLNPWKSMCPALSNAGFGVPIRAESSSRGALLNWLWRRSSSSSIAEWESWWYATDQFSGELIFHERMLSSPCRTLDSARATAFYIPYYAGLDVSRFLWAPPAATADVKGGAATVEVVGGAATDTLAEELLAWLEARPEFRRRGGADHFLMVGRISWDFRRLPERTTEWGSSLFHRSAMVNVTRLVIERSPWDARDVAVPYPTGLHPPSDAALATWRAVVARSDRRVLFAFAGSPRPALTGDFRALLAAQCAAAGRACAWLDCHHAGGRVSGCAGDALAVTRLFLGAHFCLQPRGDSFTRRSIFDAMIAGCIPVFFWNQSAYWQYHLYLPADPESYSVFIPHQELRRGAANIADILGAVPPQQIASKRSKVLDAMAGLLYVAPGGDRSFRDAFDVALDGVLERIRVDSSATSDGASHGI